MVDVTLEGVGVLTIEQVTPIEAMNMAEGVRELSGNAYWWNTAQTVAAVRALDGKPRPPPYSRTHIRGAVMRFGDAGLALIRRVVREQPAGELPGEIECKPLSAIERLDIFEVADDLAGVPGWIAPAIIAAQVRSIGGAAVKFPATKEDVKALVEQLGMAGMLVASEFMRAGAVVAKDAEKKTEDAAKN